MKNTTTLLVIDIATTNDVIADFAENALKNNTHLSCLMIELAPISSIPSYAVSPYGDTLIPTDWDEILNSSRRALFDRKSEIEALFALSGVSADVQPFSCSTADIKNIVARSANVCDIAHIAPNLRADSGVMHEVAYGVLFKSPIALMLNSSPSKEVDQVFIAWDNSVAASRAVHIALPYFRTAKNVVIACFDAVATVEGNSVDPGADIAAWLSHHGFPVTISQLPTGGRDIASCILDRAKEQGADLVVMGAYGHSRMIEAIFGGTTRTMMEQTKLPILFAH
jgi:nucleotide-binding universal stress UspA family protein